LYAPSGLQPVLDRRGGRIVNLTGDGALIELVSAVEALSATIEFQQAMETESQRPEAKRLVFRVGLGLHLVNIRPGHTARTPVATQHQQSLD
jgi:class 3 adenylate cyclase